MIDALIGDAMAIVPGLGHGEHRVHLSGHDWGGILSRTIAERWPERLGLLTMLSRPHPLGFNRAMLEDPEQRSRLARVWTWLTCRLIRMKSALLRRRFCLMHSCQNGLIRTGRERARVDILRPMLSVRVNPYDTPEMVIRPGHQPPRILLPLSG
jgi:pimeloyl-ACP methyl ester carboxylesterase